MKKRKLLLDTCALSTVKQPNDKYHAAWQKSISQNVDLMIAATTLGEQ